MKSIVPAVLVVLIAASAAAQPSRVDPDEGTLSSIRPRIPEPMVFDLVRPLGAHRGEVEVNSLFRLSPGGSPGHLRWAPEVEYTFADGHGIELELPFEGATLDSLKFAVQGTLPGPAPRSFVHGWQAIWEGARHGDRRQIDLLYLAGARWHPRWSAFTLTGIRRERDTGVARTLLANASLFFHAGKEITYGLEANHAGRGLDAPRLTLMPQLHVRRSRYNVQAGAGLARAGGVNALQFAWRISREF